MELDLWDQDEFVCTISTGYTLTNSWVSPLGAVCAEAMGILLSEHSPRDQSPKMSLHVQRVLEEYHFK